ncbi:ATP synthase [Agaricicola taiwanensis]|uniref:ATP synthase n=1 Tax=Agaricicola taiwanensis TaxID=591372 RepID=A0A8J2YGL1_9RHOB|nr:FliI/YscN family ATPase [Agaricicola taiwanensis]GGE35960.1 ATP synthase [Agaricicola taiwanensis]
MNAPSPPDLGHKLSRLLPRLQESARATDTRPIKGRVQRVLGVIVYATVPNVRIGEMCRLVNPDGSEIMAEVIGLMDHMTILTPIGDMIGLSTSTEVIPSGSEFRIPVGDGLLGRVISPLGENLDSEPWPPKNIETTYPIHAAPPQPLKRTLISKPMQFGIRALDGLLTCAKGQRVGIFGAPGVGKSTLLSQIVKGADADVIVIGMIGERGRETREFLDKQLSSAERAKSVAVVATSDRPAMERVKAAHVATAVAEYFRDKGKNVLLIMDSVTRFARAQREIGLAAGEPPTRRGFPPSLFAALPRLLERSGTSDKGSITGIYTVLTEGDGTFDPVAEEVQSILDGHVILSMDLAQRNHFPAIDVLRSRSRLMDAVISPKHGTAAAKIRELMARYEEVELLIKVGEYRKGTDAATDEAIAKIDKINAFLRQPLSERDTMPSAVTKLEALCK